MQVSKTGKEVAFVLGFLGYYRKFIPSFAWSMEAINSLRNKQQLTADDWTLEIVSCFQQLKHLFLDQCRPVIHFPSGKIHLMNPCL